MRIQQIILGALVLVFGVVLVVAIHHYLTEPHPGHNDFLTPWEAVRTFAIDGYGPYSDEAGLNIQMIIFGRPAVEGENLGHYSYPFHASFLFWPLVYLPFAWAAAIWMVMLIFALVLALLLILNLYGWKPQPPVVATLVLWSILVYPAARGLMLGQVGTLIYAVQIISIWALYRKYDVVSGVALAVSTMKPQMALFILPFLLLWALKARRWRLLVAFGAAFTVFMLISFVLQPTWVGDWLRRVDGYGSYNIQGPVWVLMDYYLGLGRIGEYGLSLLLVAGMLWAWFTVLVQGQQHRFLWVVSLTLTITHLVAPSTATPHFVLFTLPLLFYLSEMTRRNRKHGGWRVLLILLALFVLPWVQFLMTIEGNQEHPGMFLPMPFLLLIVLWLTRRQWWQKAPIPPSAQPEPELVSSTNMRGVSA